MKNSRVFLFIESNVHKYRSRFVKSYLLHELNKPETRDIRCSCFVNKKILDDICKFIINIERLKCI
jgi:hypothetical protein